jgi:hypothetical protein
LPRLRLRQVALVAHELQPVVDALREVLDLSDQEPFRDPGVDAFGLHNSVLAIGDTFLEVVSPVRPGTTAGRYLERRGGDSGYMAIFQVDDLAAARARIARLGIRVVWQSDQSDIAGTHLHPKDVPGALVSIDWASPAGSWRWAGPAWAGQVPTCPPGGIVGITVQSERPLALAQRWAEVLDRRVAETEGAAVIALDGGTVRFTPPRDDRGEGICAVEVEVPRDERRNEVVGGVDILVRRIS